MWRSSQNCCSSNPSNVASMCRLQSMDLPACHTPSNYMFPNRNNEGSRQPSAQAIELCGVIRSELVMTAAQPPRTVGDS